MSTTVRACSEDATLETAARIMWELGVGCVPIVDHLLHPIGRISDREICVAAYTTGRVLAKIPVRSILCRGIACCTPSTTLAGAEALMRREHVECLPVVAESGSLIGIVTLSAIRRRMRVSPELEPAIATG